MSIIDEAFSTILTRRAAVPPEHALLVAVSGIDGCGKGYVTEKLVSRLQSDLAGVIGINIDGWLHLPEKRFSKEKPAQHFYDHGIRFQEMFEQLVLPLRDKRSHRVEVDLADATNSPTYRRTIYDFQNVNVIVLDGIFLLKRAWRNYYDLTIWVDCTYATALERAIQQGQEGLSVEQTIHDYETIYFAAQRIHQTVDEPRRAADLVIENDARLGETTAT